MARGLCRTEVGYTQTQTRARGATDVAVSFVPYYSRPPMPRARAVGSRNLRDVWPGQWDRPFVTEFRC
jgi:hypothetical protein